MKILIVDDEPGTRLMVAAAVERLGHAAVQAADGEEGWRVFAAERPEVVITDWAMPGLDGNRLVGEDPRRRGRLHVHHAAERARRRGRLARGRARRRRRRAWPSRPIPRSSSAG